MAYEQTTTNFDFDDNFDEEAQDAFVQAVTSIIEAQVMEKTGTLNITFRWEDNA